LAGQDITTWQEETMSNIEKLLSVGDLRSSGNSEAVVKKVLSRPDLFADVIDAIFSDNPATKMRASDAAEKITRIRPEWLKPYKKLFLNKISAIEQKEVRWHTAQILPRLKLTAKEKTQVFNLMMDYLKDNSSIVRTFAMQALADIALQDEGYVKKVRILIRKLMENGTPAMQSRGKKLLKLLNGN
jgi:hypothetical protein